MFQFNEEIVNGMYSLFDSDLDYFKIEVWIRNNFFVFEIWFFFMIKFRKKVKF